MHRGFRPLQAMIAIRFNDARKGVAQLDVTDEEADELARSLFGNRSGPPLDQVSRGMGSPRILAVRRSLR